MACCLYCGRETKAKCQICVVCLGTKKPRHRDYEAAYEADDDPMAYEDDYSEESGPDTVCRWLYDGNGGIYWGKL